MYDNVNNPKHYTGREGAMETIDEMILLFGRQAVMHFCKCNAWKYRARAMYKNGEEDLKKSDWYLAKYKELESLDEDCTSPEWFVDLYSDYTGLDDDFEEDKLH